MIALSEAPRARSGATAAAIFLLWVFLISTQIALYCAAAAHEDTGGRFIRSPPARKERFSETTAPPLFHAPSSSTAPAQQLLGGAKNGDPDTLYGDDKRIIHTGPNPLHN
ncbi:CLAVATA3/ESR (CLE)-related protein 17 [Corylus avellana]|uniref:CLAVATA3/ESR (CLE)-related protein 17 n=1 Tax=Corylus avellana TaxID=13451 RepID=UPI00286A7DA2|nr:CLAVATA3/ESR (CLE)-related protein 17 [Corylus avellana]